MCNSTVDPNGDPRTVLVTIQHNILTAGGDLDEFRALHLQAGPIEDHIRSAKIDLERARRSVLLALGQIGQQR